HAGGAVDEEDVVPAADGGVAVDAEGQGGVDEKENGEELHEEQDVVAEPLEQAVDVQVLDALAPQESAGGLDGLAAELEEVEQHQQQGHEEEHDGGPGGQRVVVAQPDGAAEPAVGAVLQAREAEGEEDGAGDGEQDEERQRQGEPQALAEGGTTER